MKLNYKLKKFLSVGFGLMVLLGTTGVLLTSCSKTQSSTSQVIPPATDGDVSGPNLEINGMAQITGVTLSISGGPSTYHPGDALNLTASVTPNKITNNLSYQWKIGTKVLANTKSPTYLYHCQLADNGQELSVVVTQSVNGLTFVKTSNAISLSVIELAPPPPPTPVEPPAKMMTFNVDTRRTSGFNFKEIVQFNVVDVATGKNMFGRPIDDYDDIQQDGILTFELPENKRYKVSPANFKLNKYEYPPEVFIDKENPNAELRFDPIIQDTPKEGFYNKEDVAHEIPFKTDVLGNALSLVENRKNGRVSIYMYMKTTCQYSRRTLNSIYSAVKTLEDGTSTPETTKKVELYCFSDVDTVESFTEFINKQGFNEPWIHFVVDHSNKIREAFFPHSTGYPKLAFLDYQGVLINKREEEFTNRQYIRDFIKNFSRQEK